MLDKVADTSRPRCTATLDAGILHVNIGGHWILKYLDEVYAVSNSINKSPSGAQIYIDLSALEMLDTAGALALLKLRNIFGSAAQWVGARNEHRILLDEISRASITLAGDSLQPSSIADSLSGLFRTVTSLFRDVVRLTDFLGLTAIAFIRTLLNPTRFRATAFVFQIQQVGMNAVPIIGLVCFLIGGVVMQQAAQQLRSFGAETLSIDMLGILSLREVGIVLTAVMVAGRSASAFTAQIGTMKMREEIDAMRTIGIDPMETLVLPRILALIVVMPLLVFAADMMCLAGGAVMAKLYLHLDPIIYLQRLKTAVAAKHFYVGLIKAPFAALVIGLVGCLEGMSVQGSAESVGTQVTTAVVKAIFLVLVLDGVFAIFLSASGF